MRKTLRLFNRTIFDYEVADVVNSPMQPEGKPEFISMPTLNEERDKALADIVKMATADKPAIGNDTTMPAKGGRSSVPETVSLYGSIISEFSMIMPDFEIEMLKVIEYLAIYNGDVSYAVENMVDLGNTPYTVSFNEDMDEAQEKLMFKELDMINKTWYSGGVNSLINDLLTQIAINGAISAEAVPQLDLKGIKEVVLVAPRMIRFKWDKDLETYMPYQKLQAALGTADITNMNLHPLNPVTYKYYALKRISERPYGIPPLLSALDSIDMEKDMLRNMRSVIKKLGLFGFLSVLVKAPLKNVEMGETDAAYQARCLTYLKNILPGIQDGFNSGIVLGFEGVHKFEMQGESANAKGAKEIIELITTMKMAGLKQDPLMLGRNFNVAETMARVILAKLTTHVKNYQTLVASFLEDVFKMHLLMKGYKIDTLTVAFEPAALSDKSKDQVGRTAEIANAITLRNEGITDQQQTANALGFDEPAEDAPLYPVLNPNDKNANKPQDGTEKGTSKKKNDGETDAGSTDYDISRSIAEYELAIRQSDAVFEYDCPCGCSSNSHANTASYEKTSLGKKIDDFARQYAAASNNVYKKAVDKVTLKIGEELAQMGNGATVQQVTDRVIATLYKEWGTAFSEAEKKVVKQHVAEAYSFFRKDTSVFGGKLKDIPAATFNLSDARALNYFQRSDNFYLGRFITDPDTKKRITEMIKKDYLENGAPIGNNKEQIAKFKSSFADAMDTEDWKIRRVIDTSVNKMRNYAAINYMNEAEVERFVIAGIGDGLQCNWCAAMQGKTFSVSVAMDKVKDAVGTDPETVKGVTPFATSVFKGADGVDRLKSLTGDEIQMEGVDAPPFHCGCRDVVVAEL